MEFNSPTKYLVFLLCAFLLFSPVSMYAQKKDFVLVLDAGHGGRDPGAIGRISKEKNINLTVIRMVGDLVERNMRNVKVVYTRKTDVFIPLEQRASVANENHADMFISVHVNSAKSKSAYGAETYTLGLAKTQANLDVAMAENAVILLEDDYQTRYKGFDPNSVDSYIMFEFMMDKYLDNSISFATYIQNQFVGAAKRYDRGVRQAGFWVLHRSACPSVLIELGFISNYNEELYLASTTGQREMAHAIYNAFVKYKNNHDRKLGYNHAADNKEVAVSTPVPAETTAAIAMEQEPATAEQSRQAPAKQMQETPDQPVFKLQIMTSASKLKQNDAGLKGLKDLDYYQEGGLYKYTVGADTDYNKINQTRKELKTKFPDAFIIAFVGDKKIPVNEALKILNR
ncbi:MAG: N-acetylmuramoyl-L-alanine amidase [Paludibacter sp.]|nr:N-acetylmuramoyl-L-alanine amidase [Paludibacter sp.]MDD4426916.1 N-acetylmuramoyl-L-alanine amidase [Paludibacter sp.]